MLTVNLSLNKENIGEETVELYAVFCRMFETDFEKEEDYEERRPQWYRKKRKPPIYLWAQHFARPESKRNPVYSKVFLQEFRVLKVYYPFLEPSQVMGKTYKKFGIPNICGEISKNFLRRFGKKLKRKRVQKSKNSNIPQLSFFNPRNSKQIDTTDYTWRHEKLYDYNDELNGSKYKPYVSKERQTKPSKPPSSDESKLERTNKKLLDQFLIFGESIDKRNASIKTQNSNGRNETTPAKDNDKNNVDDGRLNHINVSIRPSQLEKLMSNNLSQHLKSSFKSKNRSLIKKRVQFTPNVNVYQLPSSDSDSDSDEFLPDILKKNYNGSTKVNENENNNILVNTDSNINNMKLDDSSLKTTDVSLRPSNTMIVTAEVHVEEFRKWNKNIELKRKLADKFNDEISNTCRNNEQIDLDLIEERNETGYDTDFEDASTQSVSDDDDSVGNVSTDFNFHNRINVGDKSTVEDVDGSSIQNNIHITHDEIKNNEITEIAEHKLIEEADNDGNISDENNLLRIPEVQSDNVEYSEHTSCDNFDQIRDDIPNDKIVVSDEKSSVLSSVESDEEIPSSQVLLNNNNNNNNKNSTFKSSALRGFSLNSVVCSKNIDKFIAPADKVEFISSVVRSDSNLNKINDADNMSLVIDHIPNVMSNSNFINESVTDFSSDIPQSESKILGDLDSESIISFVDDGTHLDELSDENLNVLNDSDKENNFAVCLNLPITGDLLNENISNKISGDVENNIKKSRLNNEGTNGLSSFEEDIVMASQINDRSVEDIFNDIDDSLDLETCTTKEVDSESQKLSSSGREHSNHSLVAVADITLEISDKNISDRLRSRSQEQRNIINDSNAKISFEVQSETNSDKITTKSGEMNENSSEDVIEPTQMNVGELSYTALMFQGIVDDERKEISNGHVSTDDSFQVIERSGGFVKISERDVNNLIEYGLKTYVSNDSNVSSSSRRLVIDESFENNSFVSKSTNPIESELIVPDADMEVHTRPGIESNNRKEISSNNLSGNVQMSQSSAVRNVSRESDKVLSESEDDGIELTPVNVTRKNVSGSDKSEDVLQPSQITDRSAFVQFKVPSVNKSQISFDANQVNENASRVLETSDIVSENLTATVGENDNLSFELSEFDVVNISCKIPHEDNISSSKNESSTNIETITNSIDNDKTPKFSTDNSYENVVEMSTKHPKTYRDSLMDILNKSNKSAESNEIELENNSDNILPSDNRTSLKRNFESGKRISKCKPLNFINEVDIDPDEIALIGEETQIKLATTEMATDNKDLSIRDYNVTRKTKYLINEMVIDPCETDVEKSGENKRVLKNKKSGTLLDVLLDNNDNSLFDIIGDEKSVSSPVLSKKRKIKKLTDGHGLCVLQKTSDSIVKDKVSPKDYVCLAEIDINESNKSKNSRDSNSLLTMITADDNSSIFSQSNDDSSISSFETAVVSKQIEMRLKNSQPAINSDNFPPMSMSRSEKLKAIENINRKEKKSKTKLLQLDIDGTDKIDSSEKVVSKYFKDTKKSQNVSDNSRVETIGKKIVPIKSATSTVMKIRPKIAIGENEKSKKNNEKLQKKEPLKDITTLILSQVNSLSNSISEKIPILSSDSEYCSPPETIMQGFEPYYRNLNICETTKSNDNSSVSEINNFNYEDIDKELSDEILSVVCSNGMVEEDKCEDVNDTKRESIAASKIRSIHNLLSSDESESVTSSMLSNERRIFSKKSNSNSITSSVNVTKQPDSNSSESFIQLKDKCLKWLSDSQFMKYNINKTSSTPVASNRNETPKKNENDLRKNVPSNKSLVKTGSDSRKRLSTSQKSSERELFKKYKLDYNFDTSTSPTNSSQPSVLEGNFKRKSNEKGFVPTDSSTTPSESINLQNDDFDLQSVGVTDSDLGMSPASQRLPKFSSLTQLSDSTNVESLQSDLVISPLNQWMVSNTGSPPDFDPEDFCD